MWLLSVIQGLDRLVRHETSGDKKAAVEHIIVDATSSDLLLLKNHLSACTCQPDG